MSNSFLQKQEIKALFKNCLFFYKKKDKKETERRKHMSDMTVWLYDTDDKSKKVSLSVI